MTVTGPCAVGGSGGAGGSTTGTGGVQTGPPIGVIHWEKKGDATNVSLDDGGKARWSVFGCDFCWESEAEWQALGDTVVITPTPGQVTMDWSNDVGLQSGVTEVHLSRGDGDDVLVEVQTETETLTQTWKLGRACKYCCGPDGPFGHHACAGPLPQNSCGTE